MLKVPPHSQEAEQSVLWSLLIDKDWFITIWDLISKDDFYDESNWEIFSVIRDLFEESKPVDLITVRSKLEDKKLLEKVWWNGYLVELTNTVPTSSNIYEYANIVKNKSVLRKLSRAWNEILSYSYDEEEKLPLLLEKAEKSLFWVTQTFIKNRILHIKEVLDKRVEQIAEFHFNPEKKDEKVILTSYKWFDDKLWGLKPWDLAIIAGRPAMWKTAFALNIAKNVWYAWKNVVIFSLEMSNEQLTDRLISASIWIDSWKLSKYELSEEEFGRIWDAMEKLSKSNIYMDDNAWWNLMDLKSKARRLQMESWIDLIIIDYLQLMSNWNSLNRVQEISEISRWLKSLARELWVPIIALSQLSRAVESRPDKRPILSDLRESGSIEQDADSVMMLYREEYYKDELEITDDIKWVTTLFIRKNRSWPVWEVNFKFIKEHQNFIEVENKYSNDMLN